MVLKEELAVLSATGRQAANEPGEVGQGSADEINCIRAYGQFLYDAKSRTGFVRFAQNGGQQNEQCLHIERSFIGY